MLVTIDLYIFQIAELYKHKLIFKLPFRDTVGSGFSCSGSERWSGLSRLPSASSLSPLPLPASWPHRSLQLPSLLSPLARRSRQASSFRDSKLKLRFAGGNGRAKENGGEPFSNFVTLSCDLTALKFHCSGLFFPSAEG